jgi:hypothetical protein
MNNFEAQHVTASDGHLQERHILRIYIIVHELFKHVFYISHLKQIRSQNANNISNLRDAGAKAVSKDLYVLSAGIRMSYLQIIVDNFTYNYAKISFHIGFPSR